jgi:hypothetical protein
LLRTSQLRVGLSAISFVPLRYTKGYRFNPSRTLTFKRNSAFK